MDQLLVDADAAPLIAQFGRPAVTTAIRNVLSSARAQMDRKGAKHTNESFIELAANALHESAQPSLRRVFNLTGTILHTNLGRAPLPQEAIDAITTAAREATNIEFNLATGQRGDRDDHVEQLLCALTGAEA